MVILKINEKTMQIECTKVYYQILLDMVSISSLVKIENIPCRFDILVTDADFDNTFKQLQSLDELGIALIDNDFVDINEYLKAVNLSEVFKVVRKRLFEEIKIRNELRESDELLQQIMKEY